MIDKKETAPLYVILLAKLIPILKWDNSENLSMGEIEKFHFVESQKNKFGFNKQVVGSRGEYGMIWRHISDDWFKLVGKYYERSC